MHEQPQEQQVEDRRSTPEQPEAEHQALIRPQIYVGSVADYDAGRPYGAWLRADAEPEELRQGIQAMLADSSVADAEGWAIYGHSGFAGIQIKEREDLETVARLAQGLVNHGAAFVGLVNLLGASNATSAMFEQRYQGRWRSVALYAEDLLASCDVERHLEQIPGPLRRYVRLDVEAFARDLEAEGDLYFDHDSGEVDVFTAIR